MSKNARIKRRCAKKATYASEAAARASSAAAHKRTDGDLIWAYRCPACHQWHIGHPPFKARVAAGQRKRARGVA